MRQDSDLIGLPLAIGAILAVLVILAAYFFVGPLIGTLVLLAAIVLAGLLSVRVIGRNETG